MSGWQDDAGPPVNAVALNGATGDRGPGPLRCVDRLVALLNLGYFGVEVAVAPSIGSVALLADSVDFLEDAAVNLLILVALGWNARRRATARLVLAGVLLVPGLATLGALTR